MELYLRAFGGRCSRARANWKRCFRLRLHPLQTLFPFSGWIAGARYYQPTIQFLLDQSRLFQQADHLSPDDLIKEFLPDEATVIANRAAELPPGIGANAQT